MGGRRRPPRLRATPAGAGLLGLDRALLEQAGTLGPAGLRSLDAVHMAAGLSLGEDLAEVITYDARMADAARAQGLVVSQPS